MYIQTEEGSARTSFRVSESATQMLEKMAWATLIWLICCVHSGTALNCVAKV